VNGDVADDVPRGDTEDDVVGDPAARGASPNESGLLDVGVVTRPHGLQGDVVVHFMTNRPERMELGAAFVTDRGEIRIEKVRRHGDRWVVAFEGVDTLAGAQSLRGVVLRAAPIDDPDALWVHELIGAEVFDASDGRSLGTVTAVFESPASDLLEIDGEGLVPLRFVVDHVSGQVTVQIPPGLLD
jgi:16S rRNA processing protein RimM